MNWLSRTARRLAPLTIASTVPPRTRSIESPSLIVAPVKSSVSMTVSRMVRDWIELATILKVPRNLLRSIKTGACTLATSLGSCLLETASNSQSRIINLVSPLKSNHLPLHLTNSASP
ncbi:hypothetical protein D3C85_1159530 [compost metagenome]